jgi:hypothetical protein
MSSFVPGHFGDHPPPLGEEPSHPESPQNPGQTNIVVSEMLQVVNSMCRLSSFNTYQCFSKVILATLYFFITLLFRFPTDSVPDLLDNSLQAWGEESILPEQDSGETHIAGVPQVVITGM